MFNLHNKTIESLSLDTPSGCMGECPWFSMKVFRSGTLEYRGIANVSEIGERLGSVNYFEFDMVASVVETSGFLDLPEHDDQGSVSTVGDFGICVTFTDGRERFFTRDALDDLPPLFWAVAKLIEVLLQKVEWGDDAYNQARISFAAKTSRTLTDGLT